MQSEPAMISSLSDDCLQDAELIPSPLLARRKVLGPLGVRVEHRLKRAPIGIANLTHKMAGKNSRVIVRMREMILHGEIVPGQRVREVELANALGVSRTPVREALPILAQEGLLTQLDTRGFVVREFTPQEIMDAIDVRGVLEGLAARTLAEQGPPRRLMQNLYDCLREGDEIFAKRHLVENDEDRYGDMNRLFHSLIVQGSGSKVLAEAIERNSRIPFAAAHAIAFDKVDLVRMYAMLSYAHRQHHAIVQALENGEGTRVDALMFEHAYGTKASINMVRKPLTAPSDDSDPDSQTAKKQAS
jgi:GntR family transcriptional regulator, vanillate catabolism transcriptional regulator